MIGRVNKAIAFHARAGSLGRLVVAIVLVALALGISLLPPAHAQEAATAIPAPTDAPHFDIWEYTVEGNTVLPNLSIETAVLPHLGPDRSMVDVEAARAALEAVYQKAGYLTVLVDVPEQQVDDGVVRLAVLEGRVGRLNVTGARYHSPGFIRKQVSELAEGTVPDFNRLLCTTQFFKVGMIQGMRAYFLARINPGLQFFCIHQRHLFHTTRHVPAIAFANQISHHIAG